MIRVAFLLNSDVGLVLSECRQFKGPSIYDVYMAGSGSGSDGRMWTGEGIKPHVDVNTEN